MRAWFSVIILFFVLLTPLSARAQTPVALSKLEIDIWPEYDRADVLIIYHLFLAPGTTLPANLSLKIPAQSGDPFNLAARETDNQLYNLAYERVVEGDWAVIRFTTPSNEVQLEYYDLGLQKDGTNRVYAFEWPGDYQVDALTIQVQQPVGAENMQISPALGSGLRGEGDLLYYQALVGSVPAGSSFSVSLNYEKADDTLSVQSLQVESSAPISEDTSGRMNLNEVLPWVLGGLGALLIAGGAWWYWQSGRSDPQPNRRKRHVPTTQSVEAAVPADLAIYCHQCGKRASPGDNFCRVCGTKLRKEE